MLFNEMDADGAGALDASALDDSKFCQIAWTEVSPNPSPGPSPWPWPLALALALALALNPCLNP